ncbi:hypothetical protein BOTBODRAFT_180826 [Botryobasidium botryosum FD-172 SS1]|uniref:AB hydrolase-1 domain-containing protein n=1 Tax=Botryobasidium botryosum (strain FD-172 SS1) TaxID=930990 RepID=A0A067LYA5_BOTB1|nr:hypothetical protein BOTBODRAFT_180826 [Botryobasidium botryosum FD-172 SS1]
MLLQLFTLFALAQPLFALFIHSKDGTQIYAEAQGNPANPAIVWVHGYISNSFIFDNVFQSQDYLSKYYMVRFDLRGFGLSDKPLDQAFYASHKFAEDVDAVVQEFKLVKPFIAGWSYGGSILADIYDLHGDGAISGFISFAGVPTAALATNFSLPPLLALFPNLLEDTNVTTSSSSAIQFAENLIYNPDAVTPQTMAMWVGLVEYTPQEVKELTITRVQNATRLFSEGGPSLPFLYFVAEEDKSANGTAVAQYLQPKFKKFEVVSVPNSGHLPFLEGYELVRDKISAFVQNTTATAKRNEHRARRLAQRTRF